MIFLSTLMPLLGFFAMVDGKAKWSHHHNRHHHGHHHSCHFYHGYHYDCHCLFWCLLFNVLTFVRLLCWSNWCKRHNPHYPYHRHHRHIHHHHHQCHHHHHHHHHHQSKWLPVNIISATIGLLHFSSCKCRFRRHRKHIRYWAWQSPWSKYLVLKRWQPWWPWLQCKMVFNNFVK